MAENSGRKVIQSLETVGADNLAIRLLGILSCGNKSAYVLTILLPFLNLSNPFVFPSSEDVHSPFGGDALKIYSLEHYKFNCIFVIKTKLTKA